MLQNWSRWNQNDNYNLYEQIEVIYIDNKNQVCLKIENTKDINWSRTQNIILGWRPVIKTKKLVVLAEKEKKEIKLVRYWNYVKRKFWPNPTVPPNPKLPYYLKVTMILTNGEIKTKYEMHSEYQLPICHCRHGESTY